MIFWAAIVLCYLVVGALIDHSVRVLNGNRYKVSKVVSIPVIPIAVVGAMPMLLLNIAHTKWWAKASGERIERFVRRVRRRHSYHVGALAYQQELRDAMGKRMAQEREDFKIHARGEALGILNDHWLEATGAARDALAKCFEEKLRELYDQRAKDRLDNYVPTGDVAIGKGRIEGPDGHD